MIQFLLLGTSSLPTSFSNSKIENKTSVQPVCIDTITQVEAIPRIFKKIQIIQCSIKMLFSCNDINLFYSDKFKMIIIINPFFTHEADKLIIGMDKYNEDSIVYIDTVISSIINCLFPISNKEINHGIDGNNMIDFNLINQTENLDIPREFYFQNLNFIDDESKERLDNYNFEKFKTHDLLFSFLLSLND